MPLPNYGLCLPCVVKKVRDGDTVEISVFGGAYVWAIRVIDCWVDDKNKELNANARAFLRKYAAANKQPVSVHIPLPRNIKNILKNLTFDRIPGHIYFGEDSLAGIMIANRYATKTKPKR